MIKILKPINQKFNYIIHVADIHVRLVQRIDEYKEIFEKLYIEVKKSDPDTLVAILGDVFHSKVSLSPECIYLVKDFLYNLAQLRPTILIAGNHDGLIQNKSRLDSLTPIVEALDHPNLFYLKESGLYGVGNILFNVMGIFDSPDEYIRGDDIPKIYRNQYDHIIALFHGPVDGAVLESGFRINNPEIMPPLFDNHHLVLLGDIHKPQNLQEYDEFEKKPFIRFAGSLLQQNHGEELLGHGYSLWNLSNYSYSHCEIKNDYGYYTIEIDDGKLLTSVDNLPKKTRLRVKCLNTVPTEVKLIISSIKEKTDIIETSYIRIEQEQTKNKIASCQNIKLNNLSDIKYQNKLISDFLETKFKIKDQSKIDDILNINKEINSLIKKDITPRNLKWKPIRLEWSNMFAYGENNYIDFSNMSGVYGILGPNKSGKSSVFSILTFCLFDKFDRGSKAIHIRNIEKSGFQCKLEFEIDGLRYFIERIGETTKTGNVKVAVNFWRVKDGNVEQLQGSARRDTNDVIRDFVGSYEDFILTSMSIQTGKNNVSFIDLGNTDRKDLLVQFIGLNIFDKLQEYSSEKCKEINTILKTHKGKNYEEEKVIAENYIEQSKLSITELNHKILTQREEVERLNHDIVNETKKLHQLTDVPLNITKLENEKISKENSIRESIVQFDSYNEKLKLLNLKIQELNLLISKLESLNISESYRKFKDVVQLITEQHKIINLKKSDIKQKLEKVNRLKHHKYDPNCKYCIDNSFVKDAKKSEAELVDDKEIYKKLINELSTLESKKLELQWIENKNEEYTSTLKEKTTTNDSLLIITRKIEDIKSTKLNLENTLDLINKNIEKYHQNEEYIKNNEKFNNNIQELKDKLKIINVDLEINNKKLMDLNGKMSAYIIKVEEITKSIKEVKDLEIQYENYQLYISSIGRDGIPYEVIVNAVPEIEKEVNSILGQMAEFSIEFETDGKNITPYIVYDQRKWPIEMSSGFERFVSSIAIRVALSNISNLPKTNFLSIDEGFSALDGSNIGSMYNLFSFLKSQFDFIIFISHLDAMKDAAEKLIEIKQDGNFSSLTYE